MSTVQDQPRVHTDGREPAVEKEARPRTVPEAEQEAKRSAEIVTAGFSAEAVTAAGAVVLVILSLSGVFPLYLGAIATMAIGAALLMKAGSIASRFSRLAYETGDTPGATIELGAGMSTELVAGAAGVALGVLAVIGLAQVTLLAVATIVFGGALLLGGGETYRVSQLIHRHQGGSLEHTLRAMAKSSAGAETLVGVGAMVLGILALVGIEPLILVLVALLSISGAQLLTGLTESGRMTKIIARP